MNLKKLLVSLKRSPERGVLFYGDDGTRHRVSYVQLYADVHKLKSELQQGGIVSGDFVGLAGRNSYEWIVADLALIDLGCISVCFPSSMLGDDAIELLGNKYGLNALLFTKIDGPLAAAFPWVAYLDQRPLSLQKRVTSNRKKIIPEGVFSLAFSSGTSGKTKCLMMSDAGIANTIVLSGEAWNVEPKDNILVVMPFSNFQQRTMVYIAIWFGFDVSVVTTERMFRAFKEMAPSILIGPPSFFEVVENQFRSLPISQKVKLTSLATAAHLLLPSRLALKAKRLIFRTFYERLGGNPRLLLVGSAPSRASMLHLYRLVGLPLFEVYGVTEFGWISFNLPGSAKIGSVGKPLPNIKVEIADDKEVIVSSEHPQTLGYVFDGEEEYAGVYLAPGKIATGDTGDIDSRGFLRLVGRKKNLIITRSGQKIHPESIETRLENLGPIKKALVLGGGDFSVLVALIWLEKWQSAETTTEIETAINRMNEGLPASEKIGRAIFRNATELSVESGLLTRNYKVNRTAVLEKYRSILNDCREAA